MNAIIKYLGITACVVGIGGGVYTEMTKPKNAPAPVKSPAVVTNKAPEREYQKMSWRVIEAYYKQLAGKLGTGVPKVDFEYTTFKSYESAKGCQVTKGTYFLGGNENIKHSYGITWRQKTGDILTLIIDGKQVYNDEKGKLQAVEDYK